MNKRLMKVWSITHLCLFFSAFRNTVKLDFQ